ncbi:radical SAM family heme chaperone HemW [Inconstantimicrobium porci]|uniref:Heme chaperone HemW n=1 Tax=Inconstantimicrobium porci TaxID=2652291 RepID=A0A7X2MXY7_9CLOT|nr:radical SAM family heme chaperone HemW [Inconstantimicrobium porci]MDD6771227.1 radical SAM family heme chaperone HemW [Inconstantimicrobium porci]MSR91122.1 oxygen-independent coproporphyrinogen III oxidase [Inconstantimicrobium porci]
MKEISLYIHIPFCKNKCMYCDFPSFAGKDNLRDRYVAALIKEIKMKAEQYIIKTVFIGGGTPTYLTLEEMDILLSAIDKLKFADDYEFTVECNPGTLTFEKLKLMKDRKVNRLSIGLQSTNNSLLKTLGRIHDYKTFEENYNLARKAGFDNINVDLMFGLPDQKVSDWIETLEDIVKLNPEHISAYSLIIEEGTPFYNMYNNDRLNLPSEDDEREMYHSAKRILEQNGYHQYEISNFAKQGRECIHNEVYWMLDEYLGCGSAASSYVNGNRYKNEENIEKYINDIENDTTSVEEEIHNSLDDNMEEFMFMGLRMIRGVCEKTFEKKFGVKIDTIYKDVIDKHINEKLLVRENGRIYLTAKGIELSNYVMSDFILT